MTTTCFCWPPEVMWFIGLIAAAVGFEPVTRKRYFTSYHWSVVRVSQVQLLQPFLALLFAVPVLGERLDAVTVAFALAVMAVVLAGKRMPLSAPR